MKALTSLVLIILSIGVFFFLINPRYDEIKELQAEVAENEKTLALAKELREKREVLRQRFNEISESDKNNLEKLLPDTVDNVRLIIDINNIAEQYGIVIRSLRLTEDSGEFVESTVAAESEFQGITDNAGVSYPDSNLVGIIAFSFQVSAEYDVFVEFLKDLEEALRIVDIREIKIRGGSAGGAFFDYDVKLETYWLK